MSRSDDPDLKTGVHEAHGRSDDADTPVWLTRRGAIRAVIATHIAAALAVLAEVVRPVSTPGGYPVKRVEALDFVASYAIYGFVACVLLVLLGIVLRKLVMRDENYYRDGPR